MQTTGLFTCPKENFTIHCRYGKPIYFVPFGDVHYASPLHAEGAFGDFLKWAENHPDAYFLGMGDYIDFISARARVALTKLKASVKTEMHENDAEETIDSLEERAESKISKFARLLINAGMKGRIIGMLDGNHDFPFQDGTNTTQRLCQLLDTRYLGVASFLGITLDAHGRRTTLEVWAHHGKGAARLAGGSINRVIVMQEQAEADLYCMGHDHKKSATPGVRLTRSHGKDGAVVRHREQFFIRTGSFTKAYEDGVSSYATDGNMNPTQMGVIKIILTLKSGAAGHRPDQLTMEALT